jgi:uncharacterized membrane protein YdjX (TVP38/TMEM64 family)
MALSSGALASAAEGAGQMELLAPRKLPRFGAAPALPPRRDVVQAAVGRGNRRAAPFALGRSAAAAGAIAGVALASEAAQYANTALFVAFMRWRTGLDLPGLVELAVSTARALGVRGYVLYGCALVGCQVVPFGLSAFIGVLFAGLFFGVARGTLLVTLACAVSASLSQLIARRLQARWPQLQLGAFGARMAALEARLGKAHVGTATLAVALLRLSPVFPFVPTNYLLGLSATSGAAVFAGTFLGCLLPQAALVSAGVVGASALTGSIRVSPAVIATGAVATVVALWLLGKLSQQALEGEVGRPLKQ